MKVVVTGGAGLIGSWITFELLKKDHEVIVIDSFIGGYRDSLPTHKNLTVIQEDLTDNRLLRFENEEGSIWAQYYIKQEDEIQLYRKTFKEVFSNVDVMYHCACLAPEGYSVFSPAVITNSVYSATVTAMTLAIKIGAKRFINCSSMSRYGDNPAPFTEKTPPKPVDPYAMAKVHAEQQINLLAKLHGMEVIHTVPHNCVGKNQRYNDPYRNVISIMTNLMLQGRQPIIYGDGKQTRCFSMIQDDVEIYLKLLDYQIKENGEIFNIGPDDREISILEVAEIIAKELNFDLKPQFEPPRPFEVKRAVCSSDKIREVFGYEPKCSLEDGIKSIVDYIKKKGPLPFEYHIPLELNNMKNTPKTWKEKKF